MIRLAVASDKFRAIGLLRDSRGGAGFDSPAGLSGFVFPFDPAYAERLFLNHLNSNDAVCFILDVGGTAQGILMASAYGHPYGPVRVAKENMWWIDPMHRGTSAVRMLKAYQDWASGQGCQFISVAGMGEDPAVGALYRRQGYRAAELHFVKAI